MNFASLKRLCQVSVLSAVTNVGLLTGSVGFLATDSFADNLPAGCVSLSGERALVSWAEEMRTNLEISSSGNSSNGNYIWIRFVPETTGLFEINVDRSTFINEIGLTESSSTRELMVEKSKFCLKPVKVKSEDALDAAKSLGFLEINVYEIQYLSGFKIIKDHARYKEKEVHKIVIAKRADGERLSKLVVSNPSTNEIYEAIEMKLSQPIILEEGLE